MKDHGRPIAFYSDKYSIFRVNKKDVAKGGDRITQFGRALRDLNIDIICANSSQAKGRVERANGTLQDRLVKEMRLEGISTIEEANIFAEEYRKDFNRRFAKPPKSEVDSHRPLRDSDDLKMFFTWQEERKLTKDLVIHYKRQMFLIEQAPTTLALRKRKVQVYEQADGTVTLRCGDIPLEYKLFQKTAHVDQGEIVANKLLGGALAHIQELQKQRDKELLASRKLTNREKSRLRKQAALSSMS